MLVKELISRLQNENPDSLVSLDTHEGEGMLDIDDIYTDTKGVILYGSIMNVSQNRET